MNRKKKSNKKKVAQNELCLLCHKSDYDESAFGQMVKAEGVQCHYYCLLFACGLHQKGEDDEGLCGFMVNDVRGEARRGNPFTCRYCKKKGATSACAIASCRVTFHIPCAMKTGKTLHEFFGQFNSYCPTHRPVQSIPLKHRSSGHRECVTCREPIVLAYPYLKELFTPCCRKWLHRDCVRKQAYNAGLFFFKCPLCNNTDKFVKEMVKFGIYAPEKDASWELEENAFQELNETYNQCDAKICLCPDGRKFDDDDDSNWCIVVCELCASQGVHIKCGDVREDQLQTWTCDVCSVVKKRKIECDNRDNPNPKRIRTFNGPQDCDTENVDHNNHMNKQRREMDNSYTNESDSSDTELKPIDLSSKNIGGNGLEYKSGRVNLIPLVNID